MLKIQFPPFYTSLLYGCFNVNRLGLIYWRGFLLRKNLRKPFLFNNLVQLFRFIKIQWALSNE